LNQKPESIAQGPLDLVRAINENAEEFDDCLTSYVIDDVPEDLLEEMSRNVSLLDSQHPLVGDQVLVYGNEITPSIDEDGSSGDCLVANEDIPNIELSPVMGKYEGFAIMPAYDAGAEDHFYTFAHMISTSQTSYIDKRTGRYLQVTDCSYVSALGSDIVPALPINAHSLVDLADDEVIEEFDEVLYADSLDDLSRLKKIGDLAFLAMSVLIEQDEFNQQRISYLNSSGLLDGLDIFSRDMLVADDDGVVDFDNALATNLSQSIQIKPSMLDVAHSYDREGGVPVFNESDLDLYICGQIADGKVAMAPLRKIYKVIPI
jgi:hypothetical protein